MRLPATLAHANGSGVFAFLLQRINLFRFLAGGDPHYLCGVRDNVSGAREDVTGKI